MNYKIAVTLPLLSLGFLCTTSSLAEPVDAAARIEACRKVQERKPINADGLKPQQLQTIISERYLKAKNVCRRALENASDDPEEQAELISWVALVESRNAALSGRHEEAYKLARAAHLQASNLTDFPNLGMIELLEKLAGFEFSFKNDEKAAERYLEAALQQRIDLFGVDDPQTAAGHFRLAAFYTPPDGPGNGRERADSETADHYYREALRIHLLDPDLDLDSLLSFFMMMAQNLEHLDREDEAARLQALAFEGSNLDALRDFQEDLDPSSPAESGAEAEPES